MCKPLHQHILNVSIFKQSQNCKYLPNSDLRISLKYLIYLFLHSIHTCQPNCSSHSSLKSASPILEHPPFFFCNSSPISSKYLKCLLQRVTEILTSFIRYNRYKHMGDSFDITWLVLTFWLFLYYCSIYPYDMEEERLLN